MAAPGPLEHAVLVTGNGGRTWHVMHDGGRTVCGQRPGRWASQRVWDVGRHGLAPALSRVCRRCSPRRTRPSS
jgi:hypothetical protein